MTTPALAIFGFLLYHLLFLAGQLYFLGKVTVISLEITARVPDVPDDHGGEHGQ
jgi:hypothetical protein